MLGHPKIRSVEDLPWNPNIVSGIAESADQFPEEMDMRSLGQAFYILKYECPGVELCNEANKFKHKTIARIFEGTMPDHRKSLTRRSPKNAIHNLIADASKGSDLRARESCHGTRNDGTGGEIELVRGAMDGVYLDCGAHIETGLLEAKT